MNYADHSIVIGLHFITNSKNCLNIGLMVTWHTWVFCIYIVVLICNAAWQFYIALLGHRARSSMEGSLCLHVRAVLFRKDLRSVRVLTRLRSAHGIDVRCPRTRNERLSAAAMMRSSRSLVVAAPSMMFVLTISLVPDSNFCDTPPTPSPEVTFAHTQSIECGTQHLQSGRKFIRGIQQLNCGADCALR